MDTRLRGTENDAIREALRADPGQEPGHSDPQILRALPAVHDGENHPAHRRMRRHLDQQQGQEGEDHRLHRGGWRRVAAREGGRHQVRHHTDRPGRHPRGRGSRGQRDEAQMHHTRSPQGQNHDRRRLGWPDAGPDRRGHERDSRQARRRVQRNGTGRHRPNPHRDRRGGGAPRTRKAADTAPTQGGCREKTAVHARERPHRGTTTTRGMQGVDPQHRGHQEVMGHRRGQDQRGHEEDEPATSSRKRSPYRQRRSYGTT